MRRKLWTPSREWKQNSNMQKFMNYVNETCQKDFSDYQELHHWSVEEPIAFWNAIWDFFDIIGEKGSGGSVPKFMKPDWFPGAKLNYAENMLRYMDGEEPAVIFYGENKVRSVMSRDEFRSQVLRLALAMRRDGIRPGDVVAGYLPNLPQTIIGMLACAAIGAVWCSCATDIGAMAVIDRIGQTEPRLLLTTDGYYYKGKIFDTTENIKQIVQGIPGIRRVVVTHYAGSMEEAGTIPMETDWEDYLATGEAEEFAFERFPYSHPLVIMFSSGTTGKPKCIVQSGMGLLLNQLKELSLHSDLKKSDRLLYITTCSWMMWNWQAAALGTGATLVLYDGNPSYPDTAGIWRVLEAERVSVFGLSASYVHALLQEGFSPKNTVKLDALREISQTGSALSEDGFDYIYREIKEDLFFNSIAGGTDINGCFAIASPLQPVYSGELQAKGLGMKINCYNEKEEEVRDEQGELVCELPAPSMPLYFWGDKNGERYFHAYFDVFPNIWRHGDYVVFHSDTGGITFYGRSDSVLKPSGVRIGTAEIYNQVEKLPEIAESLAVGQNCKSDQRIVLFVKLKEGCVLDEELKKKIRTVLRVKASPRHVPAIILEAPDLPRTLNGKKVESAVSNIINGRAVTNRSALANPESLDYFESLLPSLQRE